MKIAISLDLRKPEQKYLYVSATITLTKAEVAERQDLLVVNLPVWTPGSYLVREHAGHVSLFAAMSATGKILPHTKIHKSQWQIQLSGETTVRLSYRVYGNRLNVRGVYADHELAFLSPCAVFMHPEGAVGESVCLNVRLPARWQMFLAKPATSGGYIFEDFDELYDTPILAGRALKAEAFRVGKTRIRLVHWGYSAIDLKILIPDLKKIIARQIEIFGDHPCDDYLFQIIFGKNFYGGLEHRASSTNVFDGALLKKTEKQKEFLALLAHEHFHLWNVKRIRPRELGPFDYLNEAYTRELWFAEGLTRYYDDHSLVRARVYSAEEYLNHIAESVTRENREKAYRVDSLSEASFDAWIRYYRPDENSENTNANYYLRGGLVMMLLDLELLRASQGRASLDSVMRDLYRLYKKRPEVGATREEFFSCVETHWGRSSRAFVRQYIEGTQELPLSRAFRPFGIEVDLEKQKTSAYSLGARFKIDGKTVILTQIEEDSPAFASDLQPGDEILAIHGRRVDSLDGLNHLLDDSKAHILYCRNGQIYETSVDLSPRAQTTVKLKIRPHLNRGQKTLLNAFLRTPYE